MKKLIFILLAVLSLASCESYKTIVKDGREYNYKDGAYYDTRGRKYSISYEVRNGKYESGFVEVD